MVSSHPRHENLFARTVAVTTQSAIKLWLFRSVAVAKWHALLYEPHALLRRLADGVCRPSPTIALRVTPRKLQALRAFTRVSGYVEHFVISTAQSQLLTTQTLHPQELRTFTRVSGYVEQFDIHSPQATILEALWFSARLRQPNEIDNSALSVFIQEVQPLTFVSVLMSQQRACLLLCSMGSGIIGSGKGLLLRVPSPTAGQGENATLFAASNSCITRHGFENRSRRCTCADVISLPQARPLQTVCAASRHCHFFIRYNSARVVVRAGDGSG